ncbi:MAG: putative acyl-CoA dehydrogenase [Actinomycetia bacterium]|nr:putative acyl-CoA dehydrogenase [Actinomycetes bacterium]
MQRDLFEEEHEMFRASFRTFLEREVCPNVEAWEAAGIADRDLFRRAGEGGFLGIDVPEELGGGGVDDFRYQLVIAEEIQRAGAYASAIGLTLHNDICVPYLLAGTEEQQARWLPGVCSGELITAIAMTEPGAGSDLAGLTTTARLDGHEYVLNGSKTFITNGINGDLVITAAKTDPAQGARGISLFVVERGMAGFERGRNLGKIGLHAQDTAELYFTDVRVPVANRIGPEGAGFGLMMANLPRERLSIAMTGVAAARRCFELTQAYVHERTAFGQPVAAFQNTRFRLAELATEIEVGQAFVDKCVVALSKGTLTPEGAAMAKWWCTELQGRAADVGVQLHGGYGYMSEQAIARAFTDARVTRIYGGTTEIMKEIIGRAVEREFSQHHR